MTGPQKHTQKNTEPQEVFAWKTRDYGPLPGLVVCWDGYEPLVFYPTKNPPSKVAGLYQRCYASSWDAKSRLVFLHEFQAVTKKGAPGGF